MRRTLSKAAVRGLLRDMEPGRNENDPRLVHFWQCVETFSGT